MDVLNSKKIILTFDLVSFMIYNYKNTLSSILPNVYHLLFLFDCKIYELIKSTNLVIARE